jgi:hypothetical protein
MNVKRGGDFMLLGSWYGPIIPAKMSSVLAQWRAPSRLIWGWLRMEKTFLAFALMNIIGWILGVRRM